MRQYQYKHVLDNRKRELDMSKMWINHTLGGLDAA